MAQILNFSGNGLTQKQTIKDAKGVEHQLDAYLPAPNLVKAVHLAFQVGRPLLIMGEPGCGKTRLAEAVAYELHKEKMFDYQDKEGNIQKHFFSWYIKSTTKAQDGIYQFDVLKRMYDVNSEKKLLDTPEEIEKRYIQYGELAKAFVSPMNTDKNGNHLPNILLIDEIDKADIDFPNDLLLELDKQVFSIAELDNKEIKAQSKILIFITSNREKELPPAFLRRCLFYYIDFPADKQLTNIVLAHYETLKEYPHFKKALAKFNEVRNEEGEKKPSTSELLDWFKMIDYYHTRKNQKNLSETELQLIAELESFENDNQKIPYSQILFKTIDGYLKNNESQKDE
jgi:MoxR-like ATPase